MLGSGSGLISGAVIRVASTGPVSTPCAVGAALIAVLVRALGSAVIAAVGVVRTGRGPTVAGITAAGTRKVGSARSALAMAQAKLGLIVCDLEEESISRTLALGGG